MRAALETPRIAALDVLKAAAIVTVVWIHCFQRIGAMSETASRLSLLTRFAVPAFFFAAGFLQALQPLRRGARGLYRRLARIGVPYVVASLAAIVYQWISLGWRPNAKGVAFELLTGSAFGIYYFVPVLLGAVVLGAVLQRAPRLTKPLAAALVLAAYFYEARWITQPVGFWDVRNPLRWWGYFTVGFAFGETWPRLRSLRTRTNATLGGTLVAASGLMLLFYWLVLPIQWTTAEAPLQYAAIYALMLGIFFVSLPLPAAPWARRMADASYAVYLFHLFFVDLGMAMPWLEYPLRNWLAWALGIAGPFGLIALGERLLGRRARLLLG